MLFNGIIARIGKHFYYQFLIIADRCTSIYIRIVIQSHSHPKVNLDLSLTDTHIHTRTLAYYPMPYINNPAVRRIKYMTCFTVAK